MRNSTSSGRAAIDQISRVINEQSQPTFDEDFHFIIGQVVTGLFLPLLTISAVVSPRHTPASQELITGRLTI